MFYTISAIMYMNFYGQCPIEQFGTDQHHSNGWLYTVATAIPLQAEDRDVPVRDHQRDGSASD